MDRWFEKKFEKNNLIKDVRHYGNGNAVTKIYRKFSITNWIIIINILIYLFLVIAGLTNLFGEKQILSFFALQARGFFSGAYWTLFTSFFVHLWLPHLFFNMLSLFFVGNFLEKIIGRRKFLCFYIFSGIFAGFFYSLLSFYLGNNLIGERIFLSPDSYAVGASGAIFGLAGLLAVLTPFMKVYLILGPIIALILQAILKETLNNSFFGLIDLLITIYIFISIFSIFSLNQTIRKISLPLRISFWALPIIAIVPLVIIGLFWPLPIGNTAHFGGLVAGLIYGIYLKTKYKRKTEMIKKYFEQ